MTEATLAPQTASNAADATTVGSRAWVRASHGRLSRSEKLTLLRPLLGALGATAIGRAAMALRLNSGRRRTIDGDALLVPDSKAAGEAEEAAAELLSPALLNHSYRTYAWGSAIAAAHEIEHDRELFFLAAILHDTGLPTGVPESDFTERSAEISDRVLATAGLEAGARATVADAITLHPTPGVTLEHGAEAYLVSTGAGIDVLGLRAWELPPAVLEGVVHSWARRGFKREFGELWRAEAKRCPHGRARYLLRYAGFGLGLRLAPFAE